MKKRISILLAVLMLAFALAACGDNAHASPEAVVEKWIDCAKAQDLAGVLSCLTPDMQELFRAALKLAGDKVNLKDQLGPFGQYDLEVTRRIERTVNKVDIEGDKATVNVTARFDGNENTSDVICAKVDGKWYVDILSMLDDVDFSDFY